MVRAGQPMLELSNTNLALQVIQQESQINQAISELQQNEIALEQNQLANDRALAEIDYNLVRLGRAAGGARSSPRKVPFRSSSAMWPRTSLATTSDYGLYKRKAGRVSPLFESGCSHQYMSSSKSFEGTSRSCMTSSMVSSFVRPLQAR